MVLFKSDKKRRTYKPKPLKIKQLLPVQKRVSKEYTGPTASRGQEATLQASSGPEVLGAQGSAGESQPVQSAIQRTYCLFQTSKPSQQRSQQAFREAEEESWGCIRQGLKEVSRTDSYSLRHEEACQARKASLQLQLAEAVSTCSCKRCGLQAKDSGEAWKHAGVTYVGLDFHFVLQVPVWQCIRCSQNPHHKGAKNMHAGPILCGAFPATAKVAMQLDNYWGTRVPVWFDQALLSFLSSLRKHNPRVAIDKVTAALFEQHVRNGCGALASKDTVRRLLGKALTEYETMLSEREEEGPACAGGVPTPAENPSY